MLSSEVDNGNIMSAATAVMSCKQFWSEEEVHAAQRTTTLTTKLNASGNDVQEFLNASSALKGKCAYQNNLVGWVLIVPMLIFIFVFCPLNTRLEKLMTPCSTQQTVTRRILWIHCPRCWWRGVVLGPKFDWWSIVLDGGRGEWIWGPARRSGTKKIPLSLCQRSIIGPWKKSL